MHGAVLLAALLGPGAYLYARGSRFELPGIDRGYSPAQPIAFSHRLHCGDVEMKCLYCHSAADDGRHAGLPSASTCMNCHRLVHERDQPPEVPGATPRVAPELAKLYDAVGYDATTHTYVAGAETHPIEWIKVHDLPDFVAFDHSRHVRASVACQTCHGPIETMDRVEQVNTLTMGWCLDCHRAVGAGRVPELAGRTPSTDCSACHY